MVEPTTLRAGQLILRPVELRDADLVYRRAIQETFSRFLPLPRPYRREDAERFVALVLLRDWATHPSFTIELGGESIGDVNVRVDPDHSTAEMGWGMAPEHWGRGHTTAAARAAMLWAFETYELDRVFARCDTENVGSWRVMEKLGMQREALLRQHRLLRGERRDEYIYGILRSELGPVARS